MPHRSVSYLVLLVAIISFLLGCGHAPHLGALRGKALLPSRRTEVLEAIKRRDAEVRSYRALARARVLTATSKQSLRYAFVADRPTRFRMEALPLQGAYSFALFTSDLTVGKALYLDQAERTAMEGTSGLSMVRSLLKVPLGEIELMALLAGRVSIDQVNTDDVLAAESPNDSALLVLSTSRGYVWEVEAETLRCVRFWALRTFDDKVVFEARFSSFHVIDGIEVPSQIDIHLPRDEAEVQLRFSSQQLNQPLAPGLFQIEIPSGYKVLENGED